MNAAEVAPARRIVSQSNGEDRDRCRQYLIDRSNGTSKISQNRPPCSACWVPKPVIWLSGWIEQNQVFEWLGKVGIFSPDNVRARQLCIGIGLILNILGTGASVYTCFAVSTDFDMIWKSSFTSGFVTTYDSQSVFVEKRSIRIGMQAVAIRSEETGFENTLLFEDFCDIADDISLVFPNKCDECNAISGRIVTTLFISLAMCIPSLTTDVLRLYRGYDCNCQKVFASFAAAISVAFAFFTLCSYQFRCFRSFGYGHTCLYTNGTVRENESGSSCPSQDLIGEIHRLFWMGPGWIALCVASCFKILDMLLNFAIPTPTICRDREEQEVYERLYDSREGDDDDDNNAIDETMGPPAIGGSSVLWSKNGKQ